MKRRRRRARDPKLDKKRLWKEIATEEKRKARERLVSLRLQVREATGARKNAVTSAREGCKHDRELARAKNAALRVRAKQIAKARRARAACSCAHRKTEAKRLLDYKNERRLMLAREREHQRATRAAYRSARPTKARAAAGARVRRSESDDEVRSNLPPELVPLFNRVRRSIHATARKSRTEAFLEYAEAHPGEQYDAIEDATEALIRRRERSLRYGVE